MGFVERTRMAPLCPLQVTHYVLLFKNCYSTLDYIIGTGYINRPHPTISTGTYKIYIDIYRFI